MKKNEFNRCRLDQEADVFIMFSDASKATFTASPSSCFLANRNKAGIVNNDSSVKNETPPEYAHLSIPGTEHGLGATMLVYQGTDTDSFTLSGKYYKSEKCATGESEYEIMSEFMNTNILLRQHHIILHQSRSIVFETIFSLTFSDLLER